MREKNLGTLVWVLGSDLDEVTLIHGVFSSYKRASKGLKDLLRIFSPKNRSYSISSQFDEANPENPLWAEVELESEGRMTAFWIEAKLLNDYLGELDLMEVINENRRSPVISLDTTDIVDNSSSSVHNSDSLVGEGSDGGDGV